MVPFYTDKDKYKNIEKDLKEKLDKKRYAHTQNVANAALYMAMAHHEDIEEAYVAGLLHDNAKCIPNDEKRKLCKKYDIQLNAAEEKNPDLLHAKLGAVLAEEKYGFMSQNIYNAICYHTTGRPAMTDLEKIVYIADYIEPGRKPLDHIDEIRHFAFTDLNMAMVLILENTLDYLEQKQSEIDTLTNETYQYYNNLTLKKRGRK